MKVNEKNASIRKFVISSDDKDFFEQSPIFYILDTEENSMTVVQGESRLVALIGNLDLETDLIKILSKIDQDRLGDMFNVPYDLDIDATKAGLIQSLRNDLPEEKIKDAIREIEMYEDDPWDPDDSRRLWFTEAMNRIGETYFGHDLFPVFEFKRSAEATRAARMFCDLIQPILKAEVKAKEAKT